MTDTTPFLIWQGPVLSGKLVSRPDVRSIATPEGSGDIKPTIVGQHLTLHVYPIQADQQPDTIEINGVRYVRAK